MGHIRARRRVSCVGGARSLLPCALHATVASLNGAVCSMHDDAVTSVHGAMSPLHGAIKAKFHYRDPTGSDRTRTDFVGDPHGTVTLLHGAMSLDWAETTSGGATDVVDANTSTELVAKLTTITAAHIAHLWPLRTCAI